MNQLLYENLSPILNDKLYLSKAPQGVNPPYAVYLEVSKIYSDTLAGLAETLHHYQLDIYSLEFKELEKLESAVIQAISILGFEISSAYLYEDDTELHRKLIEFTVIS